MNPLNVLQDAKTGANSYPPSTYNPAAGSTWRIPMQTQGSYWIGQDGNVWVAGSGGVNSAGPADANTSAYWNSRGFSPINDPVSSQQTTNLTPGGSGGSGQTYQDTTAARAANQVSIDSLGTVLNNSLTGADAEYNEVTKAYDTEDAANLQKYQGDVEKNEITRDGNTQASLLGAARGSRGLYATLASLGALGGTGRTLANRAISTEANADLGAGEKSFETNVDTLFDARSEVEKKEKQRRLDADKIKADTKQSAEYDYFKGNQDLAKEMAGLWSSAGNTGEAANWLGKSSSYTPQMASKTKVNPAKYAKDALAYSPGAMNEYLGGLNSTAVNVAGGSPVNGAVYTSTKKRDEL